MSVLRRNPLVWIMAAAIVLRLAPAVYMGETVEALPGIADQFSYHRLAERVLEGHGFTFATRWWPMTQAGAPTAHWSYLYTLGLTAIYALAGVSPLVARLLQAVATGLLMPWLTYRLARRAFPNSSNSASPHWTALFAAAWAAGYGYFIYYSAALMTEAFFICGVLWALETTLRLAERGAAGERPAWRLWVELGLAVGVTCLLRQVFLLCLPFLLGWPAWTWRRQPGGAWGGLAQGAAITGGVLVVLIAPFTIFNYSRFGRPVLLNTNSGYAFFWANHPIYGDKFLPILPPGGPTYQDLIPEALRNLDEAALDNALLARGVGFVTADPVRYVRLSLSRIPAYFNFWPSPDSTTLSNLVRVGSFGLALPFMLGGVGVWLIGNGPAGRPAGAGLLLLFAVVYSGIHLLSWALIRYRLPVDAVMLVFAGRALGRLWDVRWG